MRKMMIAAIACLAVVSAAEASKGDDDLAALQAQQQAEAAAAATVVGYRFVSICGVLSKTVCPYGSNPIWFGTGANWTLSQCVSAWNVIHNGPFGQWPRVLSNCAQI